MHYDFRLVALSVIVAVVAGYATIGFLTRIRESSGASYWRWLAGGSFTLGIGVWSMHFIGMLACVAFAPAAYSLPITLLSILPAIIATGLALHLSSRSGASNAQAIVPGALLIGSGVAVMHYSGMAALSIAPLLEYNRLVVVLSWLVAIGAAGAALALGRHLAGEGLFSPRRVGAALLLGGAVAGMHYIGMAAVEHGSLAAQVQSPKEGVTPSTLAVIVGLGSMVLLVLGLVASAVDARLRRERELNASLEARIAARTRELSKVNARLRALTDNLPVLIAYIDKDWRYQYSNRAHGEWFGFEPDAMIGRAVEAVLSPKTFGLLKPYIERALFGQAFKCEARDRQQGEDFYFEIIGVPDVSEEGAIIGVHVMGYDVTARKQNERLLRYQARHDPLTGLPNRAALMDELDAALGRTRRSGIPLAVLFLDIDEFKDVNDTHGHQVGDLLLKEYAQRLRADMRESDTVARLAGDEFIIVAEGVEAGEAAAKALVDKVQACLSPPFVLSERRIQVSTSIGVALYGPDAADAQTLLREADSAMYAAKSAVRAPAV